MKKKNPPQLITQDRETKVVFYAVYLLDKFIKQNPGILETPVELEAKAETEFQKLLEDGFVPTNNELGAALYHLLMEDAPIADGSLEAQFIERLVNDSQMILFGENLREIYQTLAKDCPEKMRDDKGFVVAITDAEVMVVYEEGRMNVEKMVGV